MTKSLAALAASLLFFGAGASVNAQARDKESYTYSTYFYCDVTQQDRADHFDRYVTALARMPFVVGYHWFEHADTATRTLSIWVGVICMLLTMVPAVLLPSRSS